MIEMQQRKEAGIGTRVAGESAWIEGLKNLAHQARSEAARPFIEITNDNPGTATLAAIEHFVAEQLASLMTALDETGTQVNIEKVQNRAVGHQQIAAQAAAAFATAPADVIIAAEMDGEPRERHVAVGAAA